MSFVFAHILENLTVCSLISLLNSTNNLAIRNPIPIIVLFLLLTILGIRAFQGLPINADPDMRFPMVNITVTQMGAATVLSSLLVARLATPLLAAYLLQPTATQTSATTSSSKLKVYLTLLAKALHFRKTTLLLGSVFLLASALILPQLPTGFVPKGDTGMSQLDVTLPPSSTLAQTDEILQKIDRTIRQYDEVALVFTTAGSSEINKGKVLIRLKPHQVRSISQKEFEDKLRETLKQFVDVRITFRNEMAARDVSILLDGRHGNRGTSPGVVSTT